MINKFIIWVKEKFFDRQLPKWFLVMGMVISVLGILDAGYLTYEHYTTSVGVCPFTGGIINCTRVQNSQYAILFGVPIAVLGLVYYLAFGFVFYYTHYHKNRAVVLFALLILSFFGCLFSSWLLYIQIALIGYLCSFCILSFVLSLVLLIMDIYLLRKFHIAI